MMVLMDLEWYTKENREKELTQISAVRVDEKWNTEAEFHMLVRPSQLENCDWDHVAYRGYSDTQFLNAHKEYICLVELSDWLREDDVICVWAASAKETLEEVWLREFGSEPIQTVLSSDLWIYQKIGAQSGRKEGLYPLADRFDVLILWPEHCAKNDVRVLQNLFSALSVDQQQVGRVALIKKSERNAQILEKTDYLYVYTPASDVFHRPSCKTMLRANKIFGYKHYKTACKKRRPCKLCKPEREAPAAKSAASAEVLQKFRLFDHSVILTYPKKIVGCCHSRIHPGKMTQHLLEKHDCLGKQCWYFEKYETSTYWDSLRKKEQQKEACKRKKREAKAQEAVKREEILDLIDELQEYADYCGYDIDIIDVKELKWDVYKVFYISDNPYPDGQLYGGLQDMAQKDHPFRKLLLRHIKDERGNFVTIDEFYARKRA